ncbi:MAG TPA: hypothetical protein VG942_18010 [Hyphomonadaceae bacterium]|nr:hypothetical protein [Hyphomonadaceae bacterium]
MIEAPTKFVTRAVGLVTGLALLAGSVVCWAGFYAFYWVHRDCIRAAMDNGGNGCFVPEEGVVYHDCAEVLALPGAFLMVVSLGLFWLSLRRIGTISAPGPERP